MEIYGAVVVLASLACGIGLGLRALRRWYLDPSPPEPCPRGVVMGGDDE